MDEQMRACLILTSIELMRQSGMTLKDVQATWDKRVIKHAWEMLERREQKLPTATPHTA